MQNNISTDRLFLSLLTIEDFEFIILLVISKGWIEFIGNRNVHSQQQAIDYINKILATPDLFYWVARKKDDNVPIGIISFLKREYLENFDIGFAFLPAFNGCGYAFEAAKETLSVVSGNPGYQPILATTKPVNESSIRLLNKLGFQFEKELEVGDEKLHIYSNDDTLAR